MTTDDDQPAALPADQPELMLPQEVADLLRIPVATLERWRYATYRTDSLQGPPWIKIAAKGNSIRYRRADVEAFLAERESIR